MKIWMVPGPEDDRVPYPRTLNHPWRRMPSTILRDLGSSCLTLALCTQEKLRSRNNHDKFPSHPPLPIPAGHVSDAPALLLRLVEKQTRAELETSIVESVNRDWSFLCFPFHRCSLLLSRTCSLSPSSPGVPYLLGLYVCTYFTG